MLVRSWPNRRPPLSYVTDRSHVEFRNEVYSRLADPNNLLNPNPVCV